VAALHAAVADDAAGNDLVSVIKNVFFFVTDDEAN
jgi:hypothetical protein